MQALLLTAREFCAWCKSAPRSKPEEGRKALSLLARLYSVALELDAPAEYDPDVESKGIGDEEWRAVYTWSTALPFQYYSSYSDQLMAPPDKHVISDLADDVADI